MGSEPLSIDLYNCAPGEAKFYGFHMNGTQHAAFSSAFAAFSWWRGLGRDWRFFYTADEKGERVELAVNAHGHAYAIMDALAGEPVKEARDGE
jgi:hypothetical protein